ncbi:MAG: DUF928 domain-containing protein [Phormidesmis sp.]
MKTKLVSPSIALLSTFLTVWASLFAANAKAVEEFSQVKESSARVSFVPRSDTPSPRQTGSGASRRNLPGVCDGLPVLPENGLGLTANSSPSLFVYFSQGTTVEKAQLTLKSLDENESEYYETIVVLPQEQLAEKGGVVAFEIPEVDSELIMNQEYAWSLVLMCEGQLRPDSPILTGSLKRVDDLAVSTQAVGAPLVERAIAYGEAGIWYDLLSTLVTIRSEEAGSGVFDEYWSSVMGTVGLDFIASEPLITE